MKNTPRILLVAEHASAKFGGEAALALHYYRVLRARGAQVWLVAHERTRAELTALFPNDAGSLFFVADTKWHRLLWRVGQKLPTRLANFSTGFVMRLLSQLAQRGKSGLLTLPDDRKAIAFKARQHMQVKVKDGLPRRRTVGLKDIDAIGIEGLVHRFGNTLGGLHHCTGLFRREFEQIDRMALAGHQHMAACGLTNVHEGDG